jgi:hypothetical protein
MRYLYAFFFALNLISAIILNTTISIPVQIMMMLSIMAATWCLIWIVEDIIKTHRRDKP